MKIHPNKVLEAVEHYFQIPKGTIKSASRKATTVKARRMAVRTLRDYNKMSYSEIGKLLNKHHTSIITAYEKQQKIKWRTYVYLWITWRLKNA